MSSIEDNDYYNIIKKIFDKIDEIIVKSHERDKSNTIPDVEDIYDDVTHGQRDQSIINLVDVTADDEFLLSTANGVVKNKTNENDNLCSVADLPSQETVISDLSDDNESSLKKSKLKTFTDSDLPDIEEIEEFLKAYPRPQITFLPWLESESKDYSDGESNWFSRRRRKKMKPVTKVTIEELPERFMTRHRKPNIYLVNKKDCYRVLRSIYLKKQEDQTDEEIIRENIKRLKTTNKNETLGSKDIKSKSLTKKNLKEITQKYFISTAKITTRRSRYMKYKSDGKNNTNMSPGNEKTDYKRKHALKKETSILPAEERRRSKRNQKTKEDKDTIKAPVSVRKRSVHKQSTVYNISSSSSESPKRLKRSLVEDSDVPRPKGRGLNTMKTPMRRRRCGLHTEKTRDFAPDIQVRNAQARRGRTAA